MLLPLLPQQLPPRQVPEEHSDEVEHELPSDFSDADGGGGLLQLLHPQFRHGGVHGLPIPQNVAHSDVYGGDGERYGGDGGLYPPPLPQLWHAPELHAFPQRHSERQLLQCVLGQPRLFLSWVVQFKPTYSVERGNGGRRGCGLPPLVSAGAASVGMAKNMAITSATTFLLPTLPKNVVAVLVRPLWNVLVHVICSIAYLHESRGGESSVIQYILNRPCVRPAQFTYKVKVFRKASKCSVVKCLRPAKGCRKKVTQRSCQCPA